MAMVCPQCRGEFEQRVECPTCGDRLVYEATSDGAENQWQQTPWGRIIVGLILVQGLAYGLQLAARAALQLSQEAIDSGAASLSYSLIVFAAQAVSLLLGGVITGAGQQRGTLYGSFLGLVNGLIFLSLRLARGEHVAELALFLQPLIHLIFGALGGFVGTTTWKPLPAVRLQPLAKISAAAIPLLQISVWSGRVSWLRVFAGTALVVAGVIWAQAILDFLIRASDGTLSISSRFQDQMVTWEISAIAALVGAGFAGATTVNGPKHGLLTAVGATVVFVGLVLGNPNSPLKLPPFMFVSLVVLSVLGGWFGSQLFPPIAGHGRRRRVSPIH
jgi:hypothetical protein